MAGMLSQFSDVQLTEVYRYTTLEIICAADTETAAAPASPLRVQRLFRSPYLLIEAMTDFNRRHAAACIEKQRTIPTAECGDPWDSVGEQRLEAELLAAMRLITHLVIERWNGMPREATILADMASCELRQWLREEYEIGRDAHLRAIASLRSAQAPTTPGDAGPTAKRRRRSNRKAPIDEMLGILEKKASDRLRRDFSDPDTVHEKMAAEIFSLSAEDLEAPVNEALESRGIEPVSAKTISRSYKYKSWKPYRRHMVWPVGAAADYGPAFTQLGGRTPATNDFVDAEATANGLAKRSGRRLRSGSGRRSEHDRAADEWAKSAGVVLPPAD